MMHAHWLRHSMVKYKVDARGGIRITCHRCHSDRSAGIPLTVRRCLILQLTVQVTFIFIDFHVCDFAFAFKTQNAPCVSRFKRVLFSDRFQFAF